MFAVRISKNYIAVQKLTRLTPQIYGGYGFGKGGALKERKFRIVLLKSSLA